MREWMQEWMQLQMSFVIQHDAATGSCGMPSRVIQAAGHAHHRISRQEDWAAAPYRMEKS
jgi:hypothetical protein